MDNDKLFTTRYDYGNDNSLPGIPKSVTSTLNKQYLQLCLVREQQLRAGLIALGWTPPKYDVQKYNEQYVKDERLRAEKECAND